MGSEEKEIQVNIIGVIETAMSFRKIKPNMLALQIGITLNDLQKIFNCKKRLDFTVMAKIQKALNVRFEIKAI